MTSENYGVPPYVGTVRSSATLSDCGRYRYRLNRWWAVGEYARFIMLNPSTADATVDDPTIRRCMSFARDWGFAGIVVHNLFALRATNPRMLRITDDPIGPDNDGYLTKKHFDAGITVCAWGTNGGLHNRAEVVLELLKDAGVSPLCLGKTKDGHPRHPLYLRKDARLEAI
jgi:hypothetical protein